MLVDPINKYWTEMCCTRDANGCSYKTFNVWQILTLFKGTEGVVGLNVGSKRWKQVFEIFKLCDDDKVKFAIKREKLEDEKYMWVSERIKGNITSSKPATLHEAINMARELVEQSVQGRAARIGESNKRKWEDNQRNNNNNNNYNNNHNNNNNNHNNNNKRNRNNNHHQQQNKRPKTVRAYAAAPTGGKIYAGNLPKCNRCERPEKDLDHVMYNGLDEKNMMTSDCPRFPEVFPDDPVGQQEKHEVLPGRPILDLLKTEMLYGKFSKLEFFGVKKFSSRTCGPPRRYPRGKELNKPKGGGSSFLSDYECEIKYQPSKANVGQCLEQTRKDSSRDDPTEWLRGIRKTLDNELMVKLLLARNWIPSIGDVRQLIMEEAHTSRYSYIPVQDKRYYELRDWYWWPGLKNREAGKIKVNRDCSEDMVCPVSIISDRDGRFHGITYGQALQEALVQD
ncbi:hypothetical protein Tco_0527960 [Tanacetum coccineum]